MTSYVAKNPRALNGHRNRKDGGVVGHGSEPPKEKKKKNAVTKSSLTIHEHKTACPTYFPTLLRFIGCLVTIAIYRNAY